jgi:PAS domain S-box-containing protein
MDNSELPLETSLPLLAFQQAPIGLVLTENRIIRTCNDTFAAMFGYDKPALLNQSFRMLYSNRREFDRIRDVGLGPLKETGAYSDERLVHHRDGSMFWCRFRAVTLTPDTPLARTILSFAHIPDHLPEITLTRRERQVVAFLSKGMTSKEIARQLSLSPRTVEDYRTRLRKKLGVRNTGELLAHLARLEA